MEFCPKCGAVLIAKQKNDGCPRCNYSAKGKTKIKTSEELHARKDVAIVSEKAGQTMPKVNEKCTKCGHGEAIRFHALDDGI